ncbi:fungal specific transcription factor [Venturia nashicola]|nr:fungal specific transcription factor [Venturia nashicola]
MSSVITFAANNDLFRKRKRVYRACESCKKRRKRCTHTFDGEENPSFNEDGSSAKRQDTQDKPADTNGQGPQHELTSNPCRTMTDNNTPSDVANQTRTRYSRSPSTSPSRFVGNLHPEAILEQACGSNQNECGYWMNRSSGNKQNRHRGLQTDEERALERYLFTIDISVLPPKEHLHALLEIYFSSIHPVLPIVDSERPGRRRNGTLLSPMILQAICVIASRHDRARPHLVIYGNNRMEPRDFAQKLYRSAVAALNANLETDRIVLIQALALLSLHVEGTDGAEQASMHLSQAIHHAHTLGMQFGKARGDDRAEYFHSLFWCLWSLDKLNATMLARPLLMHDRDNHLESPLSNPDLKYTPFAVLELFYTCAAMCSHKARPITEPVPSSPSYVRKGLSTVRVIQVLAEESLDNLPPLPVLPWALSLAVSNAYRQLRQSRVPTHRSRAKLELQKCCELLERLRTTWWSAGRMADLGRAALKKASKASSSMSTPSAQQDKNAMPAAAMGLIASSLNSSVDAASPGQQQPLASRENGTIPMSSLLPESVVSPALRFETTVSPDWLNFDTAFENFDAVLGSSGADLSMELLRPFNFEDMRSQDIVG